MALHLELTRSTSIPLELEGITPDTVRELSTSDIKSLEIFHGNEKAQLADFFRVEGSAEDEEIRFSGDHAGVHWIGTKMKSGRIVAEGPVGRHLGSEMQGGTIEVHGDAGDWVGAELAGGVIHVYGRAGHLVGAAYRGSARGMTGGTIVVDAEAGNEIGHSMRRGLIAIGGAAGDLIGFNMLAGTVVVAGEAGIRHGAGMHRGTLIFLDEKRPELLPTFTHAGRQQPLVMTMLQKELQALGYAPAERLQKDFDLYHGDHIEGGRGEILLRVAEEN
jgi:formylmethanofuran dehydrogenase subunit C